MRLPNPPKTGVPDWGFLICCDHCCTSQREMLAVRSGDYVDFGAGRGPAKTAAPIPDAICCECVIAEVVGHIIDCGAAGYLVALLLDNESGEEIGRRRFNYNPNAGDSHAYEWLRENHAEAITREEL